MIESFGIRYKGRFVIMKRDPTESTRSFLHRYWWVVQRKEGTIEDNIAASRSFVNELLLGVSY
jgi:hypothetical protein